MPPQKRQGLCFGKPRKPHGDEKALTVAVDELAVLEREPTGNNPRGPSLEAPSARLHGLSITRHKEHPAKRPCSIGAPLFSALSFAISIEKVGGWQGSREETRKLFGGADGRERERERDRLERVDQPSLRKCVDLAIRAMRKG